MITLNMIVRDEEELLPGAIKSVKDFVDEIVILDTGSLDGTVDIARSLGATVHHFDWCNDFAAARNKALSYVRTPWTLWLDADDLVQNPETLRSFAEAAHKQRFSGVWSIYKQDRVSYQRRFQLFKTKAYRWEGVVHESPVLLPGHNGDTILSDLVVIHRKPEARCPVAARRYLEILLEKDPENWIGLAESYKYLAIHCDPPEVQANLEAADINYYKAWEWEKSNPDTKYMCLINMAMLNTQLMEYDERRIILAKRYAQAAIANRPERAEGFVFFGTCLLKEYEPALAKKAFETALNLEPPKHTIGIVYHQHYNEVPRKLMAVADRMIEDLKVQQAEAEILAPKSVLWTPGAA
jgi:glycosyltransferase involved in cell wall biosynthesis